jgi:hypothetical protein
LTDTGVIPSNISFRGRCWIYALDDTAQPLIEFTQPSRFTSVSQFKASASGWYPVATRGTPSSASNGAIALRLWDNARPMRFLVALDFCHTDVGDFGYPPPLAPSSPGYIDTPHELLVVDLPSLGSEWTIAICGGIPDDAWDTVYLGGLTEFILWTLYGAAGEHIACIYDLTNDRVRFDITIGGSVAASINVNSIAAIRGDSYNVVVSQTGSGTEVSVQWGGGAISTGTSASVIADVPVEVRFSKADQSTVASQEIFSVLVIDDAGYDSTERAALLTDKLILVGPSNSNNLRTSLALPTLGL